MIIIVNRSAHITLALFILSKVIIITIIIIIVISIIKLEY